MLDRSPLAVLDEIRAEQRDAIAADLSEDGVSLVFAERFRDELRYDHHRGKWFKWDGARWREEETHLAFDWVRGLCRELAAGEDADRRLAAALRKNATFSGIESICRKDRAFAVTSEIWDRDPFLLGTPGGTVDLKTGGLRPAKPDDCITKATAVAPAEVPECPLWLGFLEQATGGDAGLIRFLRQWFGYTLTGDTREHALLFIYGPGGNGKGVLLNTMAGILGDYCRTAPMETFTVSHNDRHPTDLAMLTGARMVCASETEEGRAWAESRVKQITGGDKIAARFMHRDFFEFKPQFKLSFIGNNKPVLRNVDDAARRRFNMAPFVRRPETPDRELEAKLREEWPAILRWMIEGCLDWLKNGLVRPGAVKAATHEYFSEQDTVRRWVEDMCETGKNEDGTERQGTAAELFKSWRSYALTNGEEPGTSKRFAGHLLRMGFEPGRIGPKQARGYKGIAIKWVKPSSPEAPDEDGGDEWAG